MRFRNASVRFITWRTSARERRRGVRSKIRLGDVAFAVFADTGFDVNFAIAQFHDAHARNVGEQRDFPGAQELYVAAALGFVFMREDDCAAMLIVVFIDDFDLCVCGSCGHGERCKCHGCK